MMTGINIWAVLVCGVLAMVFGMIWYGPLFGKTWMRIVGATAMDEAKRKEMQKKAGPLYLVQFLLVLFQVYVLARIAGPTGAIGVRSALWVWAAFIMPTVAGSSMWNNDTRNIAWARFLTQAGYQLLCMIAFGFILGSWH
jgi:hypothetical protein